MLSNIIFNMKHLIKKSLWIFFLQFLFKVPSRAILFSADAIRYDIEKGRMSRDVLSANENDETYCLI